MDLIMVFYLLLFFVAFLYASVGHGGASGYLALMALFNIAPDVMKPTALLLNLFVAGTVFHPVLQGKAFYMEDFFAPRPGLRTDGFFGRVGYDRCRGI